MLMDRKYYLNRSQPPMFVQMLNLYVQETGNTTILTEALPLADIEMKWWDSNRSIEVTSPWTNETYTVYHYNVFVNTAPRPEGYLEDYETANGAEPALNETEKEKLYIELASGAESGWDYSVRWATERIIDLEEQFPILRKLGVVATIPVDLTSLMRGNHALVRPLYTLRNRHDLTTSWQTCTKSGETKPKPTIPTPTQPPNPPIIRK
jgi:alpha,alpha-trehalase